MAGTEFDWPVTVNTSTKHWPAVNFAVASGLAMVNPIKSNLSESKLK
jgi:hypothetical protein